MLLRTLIVDDEAHIRRSLSSMLSGDSLTEVVGTADGVVCGLEAIEKYQPDLVLLDIKMNDGSGFDLLQRSKPLNFKVIFITAFEEYAIRAFRFSAIDYLLKPVNPDDLHEAILKAAQRKDLDFTSQLRALEDNLAARDHSQHKIVLKTSDSIWLVKTSEIYYCEADSSYTYFYLSNGKKLMVSGNLMEYEDMLKDAGFFRVHKSFLVNLSEIVRFDKGDGGFLVMSNNDRVPVASRKKEELMEIFRKFTQ